jgi:hypothetical protein
MGLLDRCGVNTGPHRNKRSVENPGGFYEVPALQHWCYDENRFQHVRPFTEPHSPEQIRNLASAKPRLLDIFEKEYKNNWPIAIKSMDFAGVACFENDPEYDVRVICLHRYIVDQCFSIARMWSKPDQYPADSFRPWLERMYAWMEEYKKEFKFPYLDCHFENFFTIPEEMTERICKFCDIEYNPAATDGWVNPQFSRSRYAKHPGIHTQ